MAARTITCIPGVTGDWRYPGGGVHHYTRGFFGVNWAALWRDDLRPRFVRALSMTRLGEGLLELDNPLVKALFVYASNPAASVPHQTKVLRGLARNDLFTVVAEHFMTDTARYADIVLPATMAIEHRDLLIAYGHLYLAWNELRRLHCRRAVSNGSVMVVPTATTGAHSQWQLPISRYRGDLCDLKACHVAIDARCRFTGSAQLRAVPKLAALPPALASSSARPDRGVALGGFLAFWTHSFSGEVPSLRRHSPERRARPVPQRSRRFR
jgi:hypothetical protein